MPTQILLKSTFNENPNLIEVGLDEAGRGSLAGPVTTAACIMPFGFQHPLIKDSKLLNEKERVAARQIVLDNAIAYHVEHVNVDLIESSNILRATLHGMETCLHAVYKKLVFDFITVDGDQFHGFNGIPFKTIVAGDNKYVNIAAASILAKTERDAVMKSLSETDGLEPYGWNSNKGYGTAAHIKAIKENGATEYHRNSFISHILTTANELF